MFNPVGRTSFDQLYARVCAEIAEGRYRPGDRIGIKGLASHLRVSPTPLREVLSRLVGRGVVEERRFEGYYLARLDGRDVADLYRLHGLCMDLALQGLRLPVAMEAEADTAWDMFAAIAALGGDRIVADVRHYLDDRLRPMRSCEASFLGDLRREKAELLAALTGRDTDDLRSRIRHFHERRRDAAQDLATSWGRQGGT